MSTIFACPNCKNVIDIIDKSYYCNVCNSYYDIKDGYIDFIPDVEFYAGEVPQKDMKELINNIDSIDFNSALKFFFTKFPFLQSYITDKRRSDWVFHGIGDSNKICLDIGSGLGNISENLSQIFNQVFSVEAVKERIEFQKRRFKNSNRSNIVICRSNVLKLPFKDNSFDLIVCNGVLEWIGMMNTNQSPHDAQILFLMELKRILKEKGRIYIGIENRTGMQFILGDKDHSGIPYTSLLPRFLADIVVKKFGNSGGIYGDQTIRKKEERGYFTYTYTIFGYRSLIKKAGLKSRSFWTFPSYNDPYYTGDLDNKQSMKGFIHFIKKMYSRYNSINLGYKISLLFIDKMHKSIIGLIISLFSPSFIFFCYKNDYEMTLDDFIIKETKLKNYITISDGTYVKYLLFQDNASPTKTVYLKRDLNHIPQHILFHDKTNPNDLPQPYEKIWIGDWLPGKTIDPNNMDEIKRAIEWLFNFQSKSNRMEMTREVISNEMNNIRKNVSVTSELNSSKCIKLIDNYELFLLNHNIMTTPEHGDFWMGNILINEDENEKKMYVIDWEYYKEFGDPLFDFMFLVLNVLLSRSPSNENLKIEFENENINELKNFIENYFGFKIDLNVSIPFTLLRYALRRRREKGSMDKAWITYANILNKIPI